MAVSGGQVERYAGRLIISCLAAEAITAGDVVNISDDFTVSQGDANEVLGTGIAMQTATEVGDRIDVDFGSGVVYDLVASGAIAAGAYVKTGAAGAVASGAADGDPRLLVGFALAAAADDVVPVVIR
jgi:hypothetical protein